MLGFLNHQQIPLLAETDILVIGAGSAGCLAALAARHSGKYKVMLVERYGFPGGTSTQMLDTFYGFFTPGEAPRKIVAGLPDTIVDELYRTGDVFLRPNTYGAGTGVNYNPERLKQVWDQKLIAAGIRLLLHTTLVDVAIEEAGETICVFWNKGGFWKVRAKRVIDASGDADFCHLAGYPYELAGEAEPAQSMTTTFRMCHVDLEKFKQAGGKQMLKEKMKAAVETGKHPLPRKEGSAHEMCQPGCISTVAVKVSDFRALQAEELTQAEIEGRRQAFIYEAFFRQEVPGYEASKIIGLSHQIGVRETRRVYGESRLTKEDCLSGLMPTDRIFLCGAPIEDHRAGKDGEDETFWQYIPDNGVYGVPYGTIVPKGSERAWVVGRCFSATHDAHASCRSMAQTMSMGQAAGLAAVLSLDADMAANALEVSELQAKLEQLGAVLEYPDAVADTSRNGWLNNFPAGKAAAL
ncbi:FAD-dependent oxidoreductase [Pontibacter saemangeumensis]|uniref:FAD-dependent oxidoreductase n=1 Tax=Pontibacter saemangeumensis TaxID=1084525 RepID=A0ABP8LWY9_9BACT